MKDNSVSSLEPEKCTTCGEIKSGGKFCSNYFHVSSPDKKVEDYETDFVKSNKIRDEIIRLMEENPGIKAVYPLLHYFESELKSIKPKGDKVDALTIQEEHDCEFFLTTDVSVHSCECERVTVSDNSTSIEYVPLKMYQVLQNELAFYKRSNRAMAETIEKLNQNLSHDR